MVGRRWGAVVDLAPIRGGSHDAARRVATSFEERENRI